MVPGGGTEDAPQPIVARVDVHCAAEKVQSQSRYAGRCGMNEGHVEQDLPDNIDEFDVSIFDESELSDPAALALALEPGNPLKREIVLEAPPPARARGRTAVSSGAGPSKRRKRALACPVCVM